MASVWFNDKFTHLNKGDADHASIAAASIKLLNYADIDPLVLDMNIFKCSGHDQLWQGNLEVFDALKEHNLKRAFGDNILKRINII